MPSLSPPHVPRPVLAALTAFVVLLTVAAVTDLRTDPPPPGSTGARQAPGFLTRERPNIILVSSDDKRLYEMQFLP